MAAEGREGSLGPYDLSLLRDRQAVPGASPPAEPGGGGSPVGAGPGRPLLQQQRQPLLGPPEQRGCGGGGGGFAPLRTPRAVALFLLLLVGYLAAVWLPGPSPLAPASAPPGGAEAFAWAAAPNLLLQGLAGLLHVHLRGRHRRALAEGYLQLYGAGRAFPAAAFLALSAGNAALLAAALLRGAGSPWLPESRLGPCLRAVVTAEAAAAAGVALAYLRLVARHNRRRAPPDAYELLGAVSSVPRAPGCSVAQEQAELILFLQGRVERLHREVLRLQLERAAAAARGRAGGGGGRAGGGAGAGRGGASGAGGGGGGGAEALLEGAERRLRAQEQEVRALHTEREALAGELRAAQRHLGEREGELERFQGTHEQHLEENQRLRSIIQEWSLRNAKLEHRLALALQGAGGAGAGPGAGPGAAGR